jgi:long-chain fatty acid transport protein
MAGGFYIVEQSPKATGRAYSGEVADTGPESLWWNPAAIAGQKGLAIHVGASAILPTAKMNNINTIIVRPSQSPAPSAVIRSAATPFTMASCPPARSLMG